MDIIEYFRLSIAGKWKMKDIFSWKNRSNYPSCLLLQKSKYIFTFILHFKLKQLILNIIEFTFLLSVWQSRAIHPFVNAQIRYKKILLNFLLTLARLLMCYCFVGVPIISFTTIVAMSTHRIMFAINTNSARYTTRQFI
jgi:hypothetical protein